MTNLLYQLKQRLLDLKIKMHREDTTAAEMTDLYKEIRIVEKQVNKIANRIPEGSKHFEGEICSQCGSIDIISIGTFRRKKQTEVKLRCIDCSHEWSILRSY